jgi:transposase
MLADGLGRPLRFILTPGQAGDITQAPALLEGRRAGHVIADTAYDARALREIIAGIGAGIEAIAVIPSNPTRKHPFAHDPVIYKLRNRIERCFNKLKHFRRLATRYDRRATHFLSFIQLAAAMIWMR